MMSFEAEEIPVNKIIRRYEEGVLFTQDASYQQTIMLFGQEVVLEDWPERFQDLTQEHLSKCMAYKPELILIGTGVEHAFLSHALQAYCLQQGISIETMSTPSAARTFRILVGESRLVLGLFYPC